MIATAETETVQYAMIPRFPGYRFGSDGSVWTCWRKTLGRITGSRKFMSEEWRRLKTGYSNGYQLVKLCENGGRAGGTIAVHALILEAFRGPAPEGMECRHFPDSDRSNNRLSNLQWGTRRENHNDKRVHGTMAFGESHPVAKLTEDGVRDIRASYAKGERISSIARRLKVGRTTVSRVITGATWSWLS